MRWLSNLKRLTVRCLLYPLFRKHIKMPGRSFSGQVSNFSDEEEGIANACRRHVNELAVKIGSRSLREPAALDRAAQYIETEFKKLGYAVKFEAFLYRGVTMHNIVAERRGSDLADEIVVLGAHYDTVPECPGADDNASGIAGLLELARMFASQSPRRTVRFVAFANEEHSGGKWEEMGSYRHAQASSERGDRIVGMLSLEMLGYFSDEENSQHYPFPFNAFYPDRGNFIGFVANTGSIALVRRVVRVFRDRVDMPSEGVAAPERFSDIGRSDHWSFWQFGYQALMVTDTSNFRYPHLHRGSDTPDKLDFARMSRVVSGLYHVSTDLANANDGELPG